MPQARAQACGHLSLAFLLQRNSAGGVPGAGLLKQIGYPFAEALVPLRHYRSERRVHSVMIDVDRGLYLTETPQVARLERFEGGCRDGQRVLMRLIDKHEWRD